VRLRRESFGARRARAGISTSPGVSVDSDVKALYVVHLRTRFDRSFSVRGPEHALRADLH